MSMERSNTVRWCCPNFEDAFLQAGTRGLGILVVQDDEAGPPRFVLQHRAVDLHKKPNYEGSVPLTLVCDNTISFCPWCGRKLKRWYRQQWSALLRPEIKAISELDEASV